MAAIEREFAALWTNGGASLSPPEAAAHHAAVLAEYRADPSLPAAAIVGIGTGQGAALPWASSDPGGEGEPDDDSVAIAFSSRSPSDAMGGKGYAPGNRSRRLDLHKPGGAIKSVPLTLTTLALDTIARAAPGDRLLVAMYGLSARVPEYGAMLDAARRGVRVLILLDRAVSEQQVARLGGAAAREGLPIRVRAGGRTMHEKYVVHPESGTVLTGTANMSTDASSRHTEHRIRWRGEPVLTARFLADFETIWGRLASPFTPAGQPLTSLTRLRSVSTKR
jgi:hypothetical protein